MLTPERLLRLIIEFVFVLLGGLVAWLGLSGRIFFDRRGTSWILLGAVLVFWGLRAVYKPGKWWARGEDWTRGISLALLGALMLMMTRVPFAWVGPMLAAGGVLLALRGIIGSALILRPR
jgi:sulfite exporter TauE/SafE